MGECGGNKVPALFPYRSRIKQGRSRKAAILWFRAEGSGKNKTQIIIKEKISSVNRYTSGYYATVKVIHTLSTLVDNFLFSIK
jgi:hypothetical protein